MSELSERVEGKTSSHEHVEEEYRKALEIWNEVESEPVNRLDNYPLSDEIQGIIALLQSRG